VLFDRDGTLCIDVPYNGNPDRVVPAPAAASALARLRTAGIPTAVISNQSGIARGWHTSTQVDAVNDRLAELLGPLGPVFYCPHGPDDGCRCRKPLPGLVLDAAAALGVHPQDCVVIGDIAADLGAAQAAGARAILVPTEMTRDEEIDVARRTAAVAPDLLSAVELVITGTLRDQSPSHRPALGSAA
jgi:D-glycero-D-manno-heptose 1,7-bisphosphate phosphatase